MKKSSLITLCVAGLVTASAAWAGLRGGTLVTLDMANRRAYGSLGNARNSTDINQYIGCKTTASNTGAEDATCWAQNAAGTYVTCRTTAPRLVDIARSLNGDSYLEFAWDAASQCTWMIVENDSWYAPKNH